jgi:hypothetical protein
MPIVLKKFQREVCDGILARYANVRGLYAQASQLDAAQQAGLPATGAKRRLFLRPALLSRAGALLQDTESPPSPSC